ncbi:MAG: ATPase domain-containing protein [Promethearchaeota archaeon]
MPFPKEVKEFFDREQGQIIIVKGKSGTGKTTLALSLLAELVKQNPMKFKSENFIYLSSSVSTASLRSQFPWLFDFVPETNILDATPSLDILSESSLESNNMSPSRIVYSDELTFISALNDRLQTIQSSVCIIDSFDSVVEAAHADSRRLASALTNLGRTNKAKIILITEGDVESPLDHIVDGIVCLTKTTEDGKIWRTIRTDKLRGVQIEQSHHGFTLFDNHFRILQPYDAELAHRISTFNVIQHSGGRFSSGIKELDDIFGGFRRGSTFFIEVGDHVSNEVVNTILLSMIANFLLQESGVIIIPPNKLSHRRLKSAALRLGFVDQLNLSLRFISSAATTLSVEYAAAELGEPYYKTVALRESTDLENAWNTVLEELRNQKCKTLLSIIGFGWLHSWLGSTPLPRWATRIANDTATESNLAVAIGYKSTSETNQFLADLADIHMLITVKAGVTILRGVNPPSSQYCIFTKLVEGKPQIGFQELA